MKKFNTSPISGMQELLPGLQATFNNLKNQILEKYLHHGFLMIETPIIERSEILFAKAGGDTEKQIYKVIKTAESEKDADQALRFDHTVPLARYVVEHANALTFPFKVTQVARNFRGERPQKGRFREFYQCDVDVIGWQTLPLAYDADVIATLVDAMSVLPFKKFVVRISNRKILSGLISDLGLEADAAEIFNIIDHAEKVPVEKTVESLTALGLSPENVQKVVSFANIRGARAEVAKQLAELGIDNGTFRSGTDELNRVMELLEKSDLPKNVEIVADMMIVRGLDYYTGTVFETIVPDYRQIGSICSGGRYENLASNYTDQTFPGVGGSIGLTRLFSILMDYNLVSSAEAMPIEYAIIPISENEVPAAMELASKLRAQGKVTDVVLTDKKLGDKLKYAGKIADFAIVIGEDEVKSGEFWAKDLKTGEKLLV